MAWVLARIVRAAGGRPPGSILWTANIIAAVAFGLAHLPQTARFFLLTPVVVIRVVAMDALVGLALGYLYWTKGLEGAMLSHFTLILC